MQHRRMQVVDFHFVFHGFVTEFVGRSMNRAALESTPGHPDRKTEWIVITSVASLSKRRSPELAAPDD